MRIRTDGEYAYREETIEAAAKRFDCNKTKAVLISCEVAADVLDGVEEALEHPDLSPSLRNELAETISSSQISIQTSDPATSITSD